MIKHTELRCGNKVHISGKEDPNERLVATVGEIHYFGSTLECDFGEHATDIFDRLGFNLSGSIH